MEIALLVLVIDYELEICRKGLDFIPAYFFKDISQIQLK